MIHVLQGETKFSDNPDEVLSALLGSCVSACIWDDDCHVGGMNHFLLPGDVSGTNDSIFYGVNSMELLINDLIKSGAVRSRLKVKIIGGANMNSGSFDVGKRNYEFAKWFIENEGLEIVSVCVGGNRGRRVRFWPTTGRSQRKFLDSVDDKFVLTRPVAAPKQYGEDGVGDVDLF